MQLPRSPAQRRHGAASTLARSVLAAFALTAVSAVFASASSAAPRPDTRAATAGGIGLRLVDVPVAERNDPRAWIYIVDHVRPGTVIHRRIEVSNATDSTAHVVLYAAAATIAHGSFLGAVGHTPNELSSWTSVSPGESDVSAAGHLLAAVTIVVPHDATSGERYGAVWAEVRSGPIGGNGVTQVSRVGIRIYLSVGTGGPPASNFTIESLTAERSAAGQPMVVATVHNTGGLALDMSGNLQLSAGPGGLSAGPFSATLGTTLAIGDTEPVASALDKQLPAGPWDARISLRSGLLERSAQATITFPEAGASAPVKTTAVRSSLLFAAVIAGLGALLLLSVATIGVMLRRLRRRPGGGPGRRAFVA